MSRMSESLGFANLPSQVQRKSSKKGFEFNLLVVGESGLGKSTLINALFSSQICPNKDCSNNNNNINNNNNTITDSIVAENNLNCPANGNTSIITENGESQSVRMVCHQADIEDRGVKLKLSVVTAEGFGDGLDSTNNINPIVNYVDRQYEKYFEYERGINRRQINDTRVHCCFYFLPPNIWSLRPIDLKALKALHNKVNIVPLISKADTLNTEERAALKSSLLSAIAEHKIQVYSIPEDFNDEEPDYKETMLAIKSAMPLAVSASKTSIDRQGKKVFVREYPWGVHEVENSKHSDFFKLKTLLITHLQDFREVTHEIHYENYRAERLLQDDGNMSIHSSHNYSGSVYGGCKGRNTPLSKVIETSIDDEYDSISSSSQERALREKELEIQRMAEKLRIVEEQMQRLKQSQPQMDHVQF